MAILESIVTDLAKDTVIWLGTQGLAWLVKSNYNDYEKELYKIINASIEEYIEKNGNNTNHKKIHFCDSQTVLFALMKFRLSQNPKADEVYEIIQSDHRIEVPTEDELKQFLEIFSNNIEKSANLNKLNIENNYKKEIFILSVKLDAIAKAITDLKAEKPVELLKEWSARLDEVRSNIEKFKPKTALEILERLEARISEQGIVGTDTLKGNIAYLKARCMDEFHLGSIEKEAAEQYIKAYKYCPSNISFKPSAGLAYLVLDDIAKAEKIANSILEEEEYHSGAWALKLFIEGDNFKSFLDKIPTHVRSKRDFKAQVGYWVTNKGFIRTISELDEFGLNFEITDENEPVSITSKNKWYWTIAITYLINQLYEQNPLLSSSGFDTKMSDDAIFKYTHSILKKLAVAVDGSEVEETYVWYKFQTLYIDYVISQNKSLVPFLEVTYNKIKNKHSLETLQMAQVYNSFSTSDYTQKAIKVIEDFGKDENGILSLLNSYNHLYLKKPVESVQSFKNYLALHPTIDEQVFYNLIQYLDFLQKQNDDFIEDIKLLVTVKKFDPLPLKDLFEILTIYSNEPLKTDDTILEKIKNEIDSSSETLRFYVGMAFYFNDRPNEVVAYLGNKIDKTKASNELKLYCRALFNGDGDKFELLSILEEWRKNQPLDYSLIRTELHIREVQRKWDTIVEIAEQALGVFPKDEYLIYALFYGFSNLFDTEGVKNRIFLIDDFNFKNENYAIAIVDIILKAGLANDAIELLYKIASKKINVQARSLYMTSLINYPQDIFKDFSSVKIGTYVKYENNEKSEIILIDSETSQTYLGKALINKAIGDIVIVRNTVLSKKQVSVKILRIMNKYLALLEEILEELENPLLGHSIEVVKFENTDSENIIKSMIENFGAIGSIQKQFTEKEFEKYYNGTSSFTEITIAVFNKNRFDAYFYLTSSMGKRFMAISPSISNHRVLNSDSKFILDVTSLCLFYQLSKELRIIFKHKFIISASLRKELIDIIIETKMNPEAKLSVNITIEGVTPYFYKEGYKEEKLKFLEEILKWMDENCKIDPVNEKLNLVLKIESKGQVSDDFFYNCVDNRLLVDRPNHFLLANDTFYYKDLNAGTDQVISPELYLEKFYDVKTIEFCTFMLNSNYVGITIYFEILRDEFINMISGKENKFPICLENFGYRWNPNLEHAKVITRFLKWLYLSDSFLAERKNQTAYTLFLSSLRYTPQSFGTILLNEIENEFLLLPIFKDRIKIILLSVFQIIRTTR